MEKKTMAIIAGIVCVAILLAIGIGMFMDMNTAKIIIPEEYTLESNESGVETYVNNLSNGYKLEIKEEGNPKGIEKDDMYGSIMKCCVDGKNYVITCYNPVDYSKEVSPHSILYDVSDIKAHPGVKPVHCVYPAEVSQYPSIMTHSSNPYDLKTLNTMNKTGHLNASSIQQYFPPTYTDACKEIQKRDEAYVLNRYYGI